jgi:hypothetical protein
MSQQLKAQLAIRYAKHLPSRKQGTTEGCTANESDDIVIMTSSANVSGCIMLLLLMMII